MRTFNMRMLIIFLIVVLVTASTVVAVTAYTSASVTSPAEIRIVSTDQALLALSLGDNYGIVKQNGGVLDFSFSFDPTNEQVYEFDKLFKVTNNSAETVNIKIEIENIRFITLIEPHISNLAPGESTSVRVHFEVPAGIPIGEDPPGTLHVKGEAQ